LTGNTSTVGGSQISS